MAKLIYSLEGAFLGEYAIDKERVTIGRRATNDIQIDNLAVSGQHASILTIGQDSFLQDLNSTNGTLVNGQRISKHVLQHGDVIALGKFELQYLQKVTQTDSSEDFGKTMLLRPAYHTPAQASPASIAGQGRQPDSTTPGSVSAAVAPTSELRSPPQAKPATPLNKTEISEPDVLASIQVLNGPSAGKQRLLNKALTTLGKPGVQVAVITKRPHGYFITHVEGQHYPRVNGEPIGAQAHPLHDHDVIELAAIKMEFYLVNP